MFPTWPAKSELGHRKAAQSSPKPPSGGKQYARQMVSVNPILNFLSFHFAINFQILYDAIEVCVFVLLHNIYYCLCLLIKFPEI